MTEKKKNQATEKTPTNQAAAMTAIEPAAPAAVQPWSAEEQAFMTDLVPVGDNFAGFWDPNEGDRILGIYRGTREIKGSTVHMVLTHFPVWVWADKDKAGADRLLAQPGSVVVFWDHYQLHVLERVEIGARVAVVRGAEREIENGKRVIEYQCAANKLKPEGYDTAGQSQTPF